MTTVVFFLEEPSAAEMLRGIIPKILPTDIEPRYIAFSGKQDLEKKLPRKLQGWRKPNTLFVVMRDQDSGDCQAIKQGLQEKCREAGKSNVLIRIACRQLESFYLGDLAAVESGLMIGGLSKRQNKEKYRAPDKLGNPAQELEKLTTDAHYQKVSGSRAIAPHLRVEAGMNCSHSFNVLVSGLQELLGSIRKHAPNIPPPQNG